MKQVTHLHQQFDSLQNRHGDPTLSPIYGAGNTKCPNFMFIFMNPTGRNISADPSWKGLRAPWLGTKQVWDLFSSLGLLNSSLYSKIKAMRPAEWAQEFCSEVYSDLEYHSIYVTNLAKCTQIDARPLNNQVFRDYLKLMQEEIDFVHPQKIVTFGNQVSSLVLGKNISVSNYTENFEDLLVNQTQYKVYPTYYPVGQGRRNMPLAVNRLKLLL